MTKLCLALLFPVVLVVLIFPYSHSTYAQQPVALVVEGGTLIDGNGGPPVRDSVIVEAAYKCWIKDCELATVRRRHIWMFHSLWCEFRDSSLHHGFGADWSSAYGPDAGYGIFMSLNTNSFVLNNRISVANFGVRMNGPNEYRDNMTSGCDTNYVAGTDRGNNF